MPVASMKVARMPRTDGTTDHVPTAAVRRRRSHEDGQSLMEFAFLLPILCLLAVGVVELGRAAAFTIAVNNGATAGAEWGSQNQTRAVNIAGMETAATQDAIFHFETFTATATYGCRCDDGTGMSCDPMPPEGSCPDISCDSGPIVQCVQVKTKGTWNSILNYPGIPSSYQANGLATMRVQR